MIDLKSMTLEEMGAYLKTGGEPAFRAKQIFTWLHRGVGSFEEMTNLSKALREKLAAECLITGLKSPGSRSPPWTVPSNIYGVWRTETALKRF